MNAHQCTTCGATGYTAATQPSDLAKLPCHACGTLPVKPSWQVTNEAINNVVSLFDGARS